MEHETKPDNRKSMFLVCVPLALSLSIGTMNAIARRKSFMKLRIIPFNHLALRYALSDISKLELLKYFLRSRPRWGGMEVRDIIPPSENTPCRAYETHCIGKRERYCDGQFKRQSQGPARRLVPSVEVP